MKKLDLSHPVHFQFWTPALKRALTQVKTFADLVQLCLDVVGNAPTGSIMISGPISTGGFNDKDVNLLVFARAVEQAYELGRRPVISQMPFEEVMYELAKVWHQMNPGSTYCEPILDIIYNALMSTGKIDAFLFMPGWRSSRGARWEYRQCPMWGIDTKPYPSPWYRAACAMANVRPWRRNGR